MTTNAPSAADQHGRREPFVGRKSELGWLHECAERAAAGVPQVVRIDGVPGIGKTSLLRRFVASVESGFTGLHATADETEATLSYGLLDQFLSRLGPGLDDRFPVFAGGLMADLAPLAVGADLLSLVGELEAAKPLLLTIDDLQWSDNASAQTLGFVLRRLAADPFLLVYTVRTPVTENVAQVVTRYVTRHNLNSTRITLDGLAIEEVETLFKSVTHREISLSGAVRLRKHTGGNPLYVRALLAETDPESLAGQNEVLPVPLSLMTVVKDALRNLPPPSRAMVEALAVLDKRCPLSQVAQLAGIDDPDDALSDILPTRLVDWWPADPAKPVAMRHSLLREAVYQTLSPVQRTALHTGAAELVDHAAAWRHRVAATSHFDEDLAVELEAEAARAASAAEHEEAARHLRWAAELSQSRTEYERRLMTACIHTVLTPRPAWAVQVRPEVERCADSPLRSCALGLTALFAMGDLTTAERWLKRTLTSDPGTSAGEWITGTAAGALSGLQMWRGQNPESVANSAVALSSGMLPSRLRDFVLVFRAVAQSRQYGLRAGLDELAHLPERSTDAEIPDMDCLSCRGALRMMLGRYEEAISDLTTVTRRQKAGLQILSGPVPLSYLSAAQYVLGDWNDSAITASQALSAQEFDAQPEHYTMTRMIATLVPAGRGDWTAATGYAEAARKRAEELGTPQDLRYAAIAEAILAQTRADHHAMRAAFSVLDQTDDDPEHNHTWWSAWWQPLLTEALLGLGQLDEAEEKLRWLDQTATEVAHLDDTCCRLHATLAQRRGPRDTALQIYAAGAQERAEDPRPPFARAMLEHEYGRLLLVAGHRRDAQTWLWKAHARCVSLSARPSLERIEQDLWAAGSRDAGGPTSRAPMLTEREKQVSHLVSRGQTNREIASELYVTPKTVEYHLSNIYAKLGITSRREMRNLLDRP
jgi:ATP/maltotriose-dependent transcriptional regulator MalT